MKKGFVVVLAIVATFVCQASLSKGLDKQYGIWTELGEGSLRTFLFSNKAGKPVSFGVEIKETAFHNMPTEMGDGRWDIYDQNGQVVWPCCGHELRLDMPAGVSVTPFEHTVVNWNPQGHIPPGIFDIAHFDFHFYTISEETRLSIEAPAAEDMCQVPTPDGSLQSVPLSCDDFQTAMKPLVPDMMPPDYVSVGAVEPGMANHLLDLTHPVFSGARFDHVWIWGVWDGDIAYFEPMISKEFLETLVEMEKQCVAVKMPERMSSDGWYPSEYCMEYVGNLGVYRISLEDWQHYKQSRFND